MLLVLLLLCLHQEVFFEDGVFLRLGWLVEIELLLQLEYLQLQLLRMLLQLCDFLLVQFYLLLDELAAGLGLFERRDILLVRLQLCK